MITVETSIDLVRIVMRGIGNPALILPKVLSLKEIEEVADSITEIVKDWKHDRKLILLAEEDKGISDGHNREQEFLLKEKRKGGVI